MKIYYYPSCSTCKKALKWLDNSELKYEKEHIVDANLTRKEIENIYNIGFNTTGRGFMYSKSDVRSPATFIGAHESYWKYPNKFAKAVVDAYVQGYKNFYSDL